MDRDDIKKLMQDVALIKDILLSGKISDDEGELSDWAVKELREARKRPDSKMLSAEEVKQMILAK
ncbi:MAG: hypothetical protein JEZ02_19940 [Desulfatibacillum sp.]|nr:hypothetical protein [Desulfatibacillum sp.]